MLQDLNVDESERLFLALVPLFLISPSLSSSMYIALIILGLTLSCSIIFYLLRKLLPLQQRLIFILMINTGLVLIIRLLLEAHAYDRVSGLSFLLPVFLINSVILSSSEMAFSRSGLIPLLSNVLILNVLASFLLFFFGLVKSMSVYLPVISSPAACFFFAACLFASINYLSNLRDKKFSC